MCHRFRARINVSLPTINHNHVSEIPGVEIPGDPDLPGDPDRRLFSGERRSVILRTGSPLFSSYGGLELSLTVA